MHVYLAAVGSLMYAMLGTLPDLAYPVGLLDRFASDPDTTRITSSVRQESNIKNTGFPSCLLLHPP